MREFFHQIYLHSGTYLNLMNAKFLVLAFFFSCCQGGEALCLAVAQILIELIVWVQQRYAAHFPAVGAVFTLRLGSMLPKFSLLV